MGRSAASLSAGAGWRRAVRIVVLLLLALLLFPRRGASAWHKGETCRRWREGHVVPVETFLCPEESDGADARLCCGTCARTYCCSSAEDQLDQRPCFRPGRQRAPTSNRPPAEVQTESYFMLALVVSLTLSLFLGCSILVNCGLLKCRGGVCEREEDPPPAVVAALHPMSSSAEPSREAPPDLLLPYSSREILVPPSSEEDPQRDWDGVPPCPEDPVGQF